MDRIVVEQAGGVAERPKLEALLARLPAAATLVVPAFDRLGRSVRDLSRIVQWLHGRGCALVSLRESVDTSQPHGRLVFHVISAVAEMEREMLRERTILGQRAAKAQGVHVGRAHRLTPIDRITALIWFDEGMCQSEIARKLHCSERTIYRCLKDEGRK